VVVVRRDALRGRGDVGVVAIRKAWHRELIALQRGEPLTQWTRGSELIPRAWSLSDGGLERIDVPSTAPAAVVDVRPFVEIEEQLNALHRRL
jgi:hypothetical protein